MRYLLSRLIEASCGDGLALLTGGDGAPETGVSRCGIAQTPMFARHIVRSLKERSCSVQMPKGRSAMNFFDVLNWMGMLCLVLIVGVVVRDAWRHGRLASK
jgi:hypothetical protein